MKKILVILTLLLLAGGAIGQSLQKGNLIGVHVITVELKSGVTMEEYVKFFNEKYVPEGEKVFEGIKLFIVKGIRGENKDSFGLLYHYEDEETRNLYNNDDGSLTELGNKLFEQFEPVWNEMEKLGTWTSKYTDWILQ